MRGKKGKIFQISSFRLSQFTEGRGEGKEKKREKAIVKRERTERGQNRTGNKKTKGRKKEKNLAFSEKLYWRPLESVGMD